MNGEFKIPSNLEIYFNGISCRKDNIIINLKTIDAAIIEIASLKNYTYNGLILNIGYSARNIIHNVPELNGVQLVKENYTTIIENLANIKKYLENARLFFVGMNNIPNIPARYLIAAAVSQFCKDNSNCKFIDPTLFLYKSMETNKVFHNIGNDPDYNHYYDDFYPSVKKWLLTFL
jgi:hypothetical protein